MPNQDMLRSLPNTSESTALVCDDALFDACKHHVIKAITSTAPGAVPFRHMYVEQIFPSDFYEKLHAHMLRCKQGNGVSVRTQDNAEFRNQRFNFADSQDPVVDCIRRIFSDPDVKRAALSKFFVEVSSELLDAVAIHEGEFEYIFTKADRFQNIHVDIPPKFLSFVFYTPEGDVSRIEEERNATVLYDKTLTPRYGARYKPNSLCIFAPHFYSYHGFSTTMERDALVMFWINRDEMSRWNTLRQDQKDQAPFAGLLDSIDAKLRRFPLIEYASREGALESEKAACKVNAPRGRVMLPSHKTAN